MSSYVGLAILVLWGINFLSLVIVSGDFHVVILGLIFTFFISVLAALLDTKIDSRSKNNKEDK